MTRSKVPTASSLVEVLQRLRPNVRSGSVCEGVVPSWQRGPTESGGMAVCCLIGGMASWRIFHELEDKCEAVAEDREFIGAGEALRVASDMLWELAEDQSRSPRDVGSAGFARLTSAPAQRLALVPIYGVNLIGTVDCCGVALRPFDPSALAHEFSSSDEDRMFVESALERDRDKVHLYAVARVAGDHERSVDIVARRARLALVLGLLSNPIRDQTWWDEWSASFVPTSSFSLRSFTSAGGTEGHQISRYGLPLQYYGNRVESAVRARSGLAALDRLGPMALRDGTDMQRRLVRAAVLLADSLDGTPADRFIRRWMALEALVGREPGEVTERLAERLAVLTTDDNDERLRRKRFFRDQYGLRNELAHGRQVPVLKRTGDLFKFLSFAALERAAMFSDLMEEGFFTALDSAKFRGGALTIEPWLDSTSFVRIDV